MGRSGVFCAAFNALDQMQSEGMVNILHMTKILLNQRPGIIQTSVGTKSVIVDTAGIGQCVAVSLSPVR